MSENHPPATTPNANANGNTNNSAPAPASGGAANQNNPQSSRGLPYYEKLRRELRDTLQKKRLMDKSMVCCPRPLSFTKPAREEREPYC